MTLGDVPFFEKNQIDTWVNLHLSLMNMAFGVIVLGCLTGSFKTVITSMKY